jgi:translation initiation factor IF-2
MSKVRINDLAREMEVKSRQILDILAELGLAAGKTHSSSLEEYEAEKVRVHLDRGSRSSASSSASRAPQAITPKIDLSHVSKPGDVLKAILANKQKEELEARQSHAPVRPQTPPPAVVKPAAPPVVAAAPPAAPARPEPRKIVPQPRSAPPIVACHCLAAAHWTGGCQGSRRRSHSDAPGSRRRAAACRRSGQAPRGARIP